MVYVASLSYEDHDFCGQFHFFDFVLWARFMWSLYCNTRGIEVQITICATKIPAIFTEIIAARSVTCDENRA
jgi:hypothetical protein